MNKVKNAFAAALYLFSSAVLADASCVALMSDLISYADIKPDGHETKYNTVDVKMATNQRESKYVSYAYGSLAKQLTPKPGMKMPVYALVGDSLQTFSDRSMVVKLSDPVAPVTQNFLADKKDNLGMTFMNDGTVELVLKSWGNGKVTMNGACIENMLYAVKDGTFYTFSFQRSIYTW
jgi:hypothetical protein